MGCQSRQPESGPGPHSESEVTARVTGVCQWVSKTYNQATHAASGSDTTVRTAACYSQADHHRQSQAFKASVIVNNNAKHNSFVLTEGTFSLSSSRAKLSDVAQYQDNAKCAMLSFFNAEETCLRTTQRGIPLCELPHKDNELDKQKHKETKQKLRTTREEKLLRER